MPVVADLDELDRERSRVEAVGCAWYGELGIAGRRYCTLSDASGARIAQFHFFQADSPHVVRHLAFRDYLRAYPEVARAYEAEKRRIRDLHPTDSHAYADEKSSWIGKVEAKAVIWFAERPAE